MAEIASAYPTAGGLYYWASKLGVARRGAGSPAGSTSSGRSPSPPRSATASRRSATALLELLVRLPERQGVHLPDCTRRSSSWSLALADQPAQRQHHGAAEHGLRVLAHGRRGVHRRWCSASCRTTTSRSRTSSRETVNAPGSGARRHFGEPRLLVRVPDRASCMARSTRSPASTPRRTWPRKRTRRPARRPSACTCRWSSSVVFGFILLVAVTFAIPSTDGAIEQHRLHRAVDLGGVDGPELGGGPALHLRRRAVLLRHGIDHVGVADDVRVLARPAPCPGHQLWRQGRRGTACRGTR